MLKNLSVNQVDSILTDKLVAIIGSIGNILLRIENSPLVANVLTLLYTKSWNLVAVEIDTCKILQVES
nr:MAG TPA: hypothetical protein [Bacteriophage sp.]